MVLVGKPSGRFASLSTKIPPAPGVTQLRFPLCSLSPLHYGQGGQTQPGPIREDIPAQHPPTHLPPSPRTSPLPNARGLSHLSLLCFARTGWKETTARPTVSLYPLIFSQYRRCQIVVQT